MVRPYVSGPNLGSIDVVVIRATLWPDSVPVLVHRRELLCAVTGSTALVSSGCFSSARRALGEREQANQQSDSGVTVADAKLDLQKYASHEAALDDGYERGPTCVEGLGVPFEHPEHTELSWKEPQVLFYDPTESGSFDLLGVAWYVPADATDSPPTMFAGDDQQTFDGPTEGHFPGQPEHYGLHAWLFSDNPNGEFATYGPSVDC